MNKKLLIVFFSILLSFSLSGPAEAYQMQIQETFPFDMSMTHAAYIDSSGSLWTWGRNASGELGIGSQESSSVPVKVMDGVADVSLGNGVTAALKTDGSLWMWGSNYHGQLGTNGSGDVDIGGGNNFDHASKHFIHTSPVKVMDDVASVQAGSYYTAVIKTDGSLWMWGDNQYGHIGNGGLGNKTDRYSYVYQTIPVKVMDSVSFVTFNDDAHAVAAIKTDGTLWTWGLNAYGELGNGGIFNDYNEYEELDYQEIYQTLPLQVLDNVTDVRIGVNHMAAIKTDGSLWMWGSNRYGQLGNGTTADSDIPVKIMDNVAAVDLGWSRTSVLKTDGTLWTCGLNYFGQLGTGSNAEYSSIPTQILDNVAAASGHWEYAAALKTDGSLWTWGWNYHGQLGNGSNENTDVPVKVLDNTAAVSGHQNSMMAVKTDGTIWTWGWNYYGQLGNGTTAASSVPAKMTDSGSPFTDVSRDAYYYEPVLWAVNQGITNGVTASAFAPDAVCTRGEIITFLWRAMGSPTPSGTGIPCADVLENDFYCQPVRWAYEQGMVSGDRFSPKDPCTRAQTVEFLWKAAGSPAANTAAGFTDVPADYARAVDWAAEQGIVTGTGGTAFSPDDTCTRGQIVTLLWRGLVQ